MNAPLQTAILPKLKALSLNGVCSYHIDGEQIFMDVEEIANNRDNGNTSGTLSMEMWALSQPYQGGAFSGHQVAAGTIGEVQGQYCLRHWHHIQRLNTPDVGQWYMVMMLREWDNGAYITRDFINFPEPVTAQSTITLSLSGLPMIFRPQLEEWQR